MAGLIRSTLRFNVGDIFPVDAERIDDIALNSVASESSGDGLYGGILFPILGHFFFESLSRIWPLLWSRRPDGSGIPIYFHPWPGLDPATFFNNGLYRETFGALGINLDRIRIIERPMRFNTLIVADPASAYHLNLDQRMNSLFDVIAEGIRTKGASASPEQRVRRIYLSRSLWQDNRRILNEEAIDAEMAARGFEIVHTQTLSPNELMTLLHNTHTMIATDGSHAHMAAFCRAGTRIVMLDTRPVPTQFAIGLLRNLRVIHLPLFQTHLYRMEIGITDPGLLGRFVDLALDALN